MKKILLSGLFLALWIVLPQYAQAQTCEPRVNVPDYETGKPAPIVCDTHGSQHVVITDTNGANISSVTATETAPSYAEGATNVPLSVDLQGNVRTTPGTCTGGDSHCVGTDPDSYQRVRTHATPSARVTSDTQIKASAGWVGWLTCMPTDATATAGTIIVYDNTAESGTVLQQFDVLAISYTSPIVLPIQAVASTGIYLGFTTTADMACTVFYK